ncbi:MAG: KpsF/GutQ family sugar-phosphate isomerase [gamma proteobacterium symbiont of Bathyaustriella thionipta]|nr:KpsF/GutQ family sugar-phosphate isomerase [gamma proteobacterium symbiont of Bathyaustriella thionipta]MCU7951010.1 KpsF/GutQ family sugar-phosphate isomerase [gamma proteobacterium symbiont of Bathyaustriella thionipta]MCU7953949.1 KpsF/GutQ family sugar-phosphate isomerase [gamma proteobacterium symbiont of Bathyaustriella thionipta]MCU7957518.1 KpsF/GutQ family sugar-phosphate isomerase [gamma proteobacterium symbiont of Bathyaustriella thionipta]MCU7968342.1 KpsF/GutQ family sugar-phosp
MNNNQSPMLLIAKESLTEQAKALINMSEELGDEFVKAVNMILNTKGRVVVCGMGKSGLVGQKMTATFASTGTPSFFMHPAEAFHGDLGMLMRVDLLILISYSGETEEIINLLPSLKHFGNNIISIVGNVDSTMAKHSDVILSVKVEREVCPNNLAPTTSTLATMGMGDALAVALIKARNFQAEDFARYHPGGSLGKRLLTKVADVMHATNLPVITRDTPLKDAVVAISEGRLGLVVIVENVKVKGIVTDGDLRRALVKQIDMNQASIGEIMTISPITITPDTMLVDAEALMLEKKIKALIVADQNNHLSGILEIFDR